MVASRRRSSRRRRGRASPASASTLPPSVPIGRSQEPSKHSRSAASVCARWAWGIERTLPKSFSVRIPKSPILRRRPPLAPCATSLRATPRKKRRFREGRRRRYFVEVVQREEDLRLAARGSSDEQKPDGVAGHPVRGDARERHVERAGVGQVQPAAKRLEHVGERLRFDGSRCLDRALRVGLVAAGRRPPRARVSRSREAAAGSVSSFSTSSAARIAARAHPATAHRAGEREKLLPPLAFGDDGLDRRRWPFLRLPGVLEEPFGRLCSSSFRCGAATGTGARSRAGSEAQRRNRRLRARRGRARASRRCSAPRGRGGRRRCASRRRRSAPRALAGVCRACARARQGCRRLHAGRRRRARGARKRRPSGCRSPLPGSASTTRARPPLPCSRRGSHARSAEPSRCRGRPGGRGPHRRPRPRSEQPDALGRPPQKGMSPSSAGRLSPESASSTSSEASELSRSAAVRFGAACSNVTLKSR